jgi:hypothetical protein
VRFDQTLDRLRLRTTQRRKDPISGSVADLAVKARVTKSLQAMSDHLRPVQPHSSRHEAVHH